MKYGVAVSRRHDQPACACAVLLRLFAFGANGSTALRGRAVETRAHPKGLDLSCIDRSAHIAQASPMSFDHNIIPREKPMHADIASSSPLPSDCIKSLWSLYCEKLAKPEPPAVIPFAAGPAVGRREALRIWAALAPEARAPLFQSCPA